MAKPNKSWGEEREQVNVAPSDGDKQETSRVPSVHPKANNKEKEISSPCDQLSFSVKGDLILAGYRELSCGEQDALRAQQCQPCRNTIPSGTAMKGTAHPHHASAQTCSSDAAHKAQMSEVLCRLADDTLRLMTLWYSLLWITLHS